MDAVLIGIAIGIAAGIAPGPLLVLVITQTMRSGLRAGLLTAAAPLMSDVLVIAVTLTVVSRVPSVVLAIITALGGLYIVWSGVETWRASATDPGQERTKQAATGALRRAVVINILSPHPWVTWATVLGPLVVRSWHQSLPTAVSIVVAFYAVLVISKSLVAAAVARGGRSLSVRIYSRTLQIAACILVVIGLVLVVEAAISGARAFAV